MPMFVQTDRVPVSDEAGNTVYIKRKMSFGDVSKIQAAGKDDHLLALYVANIVDWQGPDFKGVDCTPENIALLDPNEPLIELVGNKIAELNPQKESPNPKSRTTSGSKSTGSRY